MSSKGKRKPVPPKKKELNTLTSMIENLEIDKKYVNVVYVESDETGGHAHLFKSEFLEDALDDLRNHVDVVEYKSLMNESDDDDEDDERNDDEEEEKREDIMKYYYQFPKDASTDKFDPYEFDEDAMVFPAPNDHIGLWSNDIYKVLKQVHPDTMLSDLSVAIINDMITDLIKRFVSELRNLDPVDEIKEKVYEPTTLLQSCIKLVEKEKEKVGNKAIPIELKEKLGFGLVKDKPTTRDMISTVIRFIFPGQLAIHALSESVKATTKYEVYDDDEDVYKEEDISLKSGLQFSVIKTAQFFYNEKNFNITTLALVAITATLEYLTAEIIELSGNVSRDYHSSLIRSRHLSFAIKCDEELNSLFRNTIIPYSGVVPNIHTFLLPKRKWNDFSSNKSNFTSEDLYEYIGNNQITDVLIIDPITLKYHCEVEADEIDVDLHGVTYCSIINESQCDRCKEETTKLEKMSKEQILLKCGDILKSLKMRFENEKRVKDKMIDDFIREMTKFHLGENISVEEADIISLREIRTEQRKRDLIIPKRSFQILIKEILGNDKDISMEALEALQIASEDHLVNLFTDAMIEAVHRKSVMIEPKDMQISKRVRRER